MKYFKTTVKDSRTPLFSPSYPDSKDPCPVFDGTTWHIYGSAGSSSSETWKILHATATHMDGPWTEEEPVRLRGLLGDHVAAPGVIFDHGEGVFHMFVQTEFMALNGTIEHLTSSDGKIFSRTGTILASLPGTEEAGIYDPHPAEIRGRKYITYSGCETPGRPDIFLLESESGSWHGPWVRRGRILSHEEVPFHNQLDYEDYEWGLEGSQLLELSEDWVLLNAVCFLPRGPRGTRQRIFFAMAKDPKGPYVQLGPILNPEEQEEWARGENGHAAGVKVDGELVLFYQARGVGERGNWRYGRATLPIEQILEIGPKNQG